MFIVQGKSSDLAGGTKVVRDTREDALETANDFLAQGIPSVTIEADGRVYTTAEFALNFIDPRA
jgi:hypothetical protein